MSIPKKITPNNLIDTIVEIRFLPDVAIELFPGVLDQIFENYEYISNIQSQKTVKLNPQNKLTFGLSPVGFFSNDEVKIQINEGAIIFNNINEYIGWEKYYQHIEEAIRGIEKINIIKKFTRIGLRYISKFEEINIFQNIKGTIDLNVNNKDMSNSTTRTEFFEDEKRIILNLSNLIQKQDAPNYSLFDIDVISELTEDNSESIFKIIEQCHQKQKEVFFNLITDEFLKTLNPEY